MRYFGRNPLDEEIQDLARKAKTGDPKAIRRLRILQRRAGYTPPMPGPWTHFRDMHTGEGRVGRKTNWDHIYIEAPQEEAIVIFENRFKRHPQASSCRCCGPDYSVDEYPTLEEAIRYEPFALNEHLLRKDVLIISDEQIIPEERVYRRNPEERGDLHIRKLLRSLEENSDIVTIEKVISECQRRSCSAEILHQLHGAIKKIHRPLWEQVCSSAKNRWEQPWNEQYEETNRVFDKFLELPSLPELFTYYREPSQNHYLQLHANRTMFKLESGIDDMDLYEILLRDAINLFETTTRTKLHFLGRQGRHICVEDTEENRRNYDYLQEIALKLEQDVIKIYNDLL